MTFKVSNQPTAQTIIELSSDFTGITAVTTAETEVQLAAVTNAGGFFVKGHPDNTDTVWVMFEGQTKSSAFPLNASEVMYLPVNDLTHVFIDADVNGEKVCWIKA